MKKYFALMIMMFMLLPAGARAQTADTLSHTELRQLLIQLVMELQRRASVQVETPPVYTFAPADAALKNFVPVTPRDHILGSKDARIVVVTYSDLDCPFCKRFDEVMRSVVERHDGDVAWVYRHFPLVQLNPNAKNLAVISECVALDAGNQAFWKFTEQVFETRGINDRTDMARVNDFVKTAGASVTAVSQCVAHQRTAGAVDADYQEGRDIELIGVPSSIIVANNTLTPVQGAMPQEMLEDLIRRELNR